MSDTWSYSLLAGSSRFELTEGEVTVGRSRSCAVRLDDESVSRAHAVIRCQLGEIRVRDLGSSNGTFVGDRRAEEESAARNGDLIRFGNVLLTVEISANRESKESPPRVGVPCGACGTKNHESRETCLHCGGKLATEVAREFAAQRPTTRVPATGEVVLRNRGAAKDAAPPPAPNPPAGSPPSQAHPEAAAPGVRLAAALVDAMLVLAIDLLFLLPALLLILIRASLGSPAASSEWLYALLLKGLLLGAIIAAIAYLVRGPARSRGTIGYRIFHLEVVGPNGESPIGWRRSLARFLAWVVAILPAGLGLLTVFLDPQRRALHDRLSGTKVIRNVGVSR